MESQSTPTIMNQIRGQVDHKIKRVVMEEMVNYITNQFKNNEIVLWGTNQPRSFVSDMVYLTLYREIDGCSLDELRHIYHTYKLGSTSFGNNVNNIRKSLFGWAKTKILPQRFSDWRTAARHTKLATCINDANLMIDSIDCLLEHSNTRGPQSEYWSGKEGGPALRFMVISDFKGRIQTVFGGYSPKVYDGTLVHLFHPYFEYVFAEGVFLADTHFNVVQRYFTTPKFHTTTPETANAMQSDDPEQAEGLSVATKKQLAKNKAIKAVRGKIEKDLAMIVKPFKSLQTKWRDDETHLTYMFFIVCAIRNLSL